MRVIAGLCAAIITLAACSSPSRTRPASTATSMTTVSGPATDSSRTKQWVNLALQQGAPVLAAVAARKHCPVVDRATDNPTCRLTRASFILRVDTFGIYMGGAAQEYGDPPTEIAGLVRQSVRASDAMDAADQTYGKACFSRGASLDTAACRSAEMNWARAVNDVVEAIEGWKTYAK